MRIEIPTGLLFNLLGTPDELMAHAAARGSKRPVVHSAGEVVLTTAEVRSAITGKTVTGYRYVGMTADADSTRVALDVIFEE